MFWSEKKSSVVTRSYRVTAEGDVLSVEWFHGAGTFLKSGPNRPDQVVGKYWEFFASASVPVEARERLRGLELALNPLRYEPGKAPVVVWP